MKVRLALFTSLLTLSALAAACGSDSKSKSTEEQSATPAQAIDRIGKVRNELDRALVKYKAGDKKGADQIVGDAYLEEFEAVEAPLEKVDKKLVGELEAGIRQRLRAKIKAGAPVPEIASDISSLKKRLDKAEAALQ